MSSVRPAGARFRKGGSMIWMSLSRTLKVPCAMSHLRERAVRREHVEPVEGARESASCEQACGSERYVRTPALSKAGRSQSEVTRAAREPRERWPHALPRAA